MFGQADPLKMRILSGSFRADRPVTHAPLPDLPECPDCLDGAAKTKWTELCRMLGEMDLLDAADRDMMALYCTAFSQWREAADMVRKSGLLIKGASGVCANPCVKIAADAKREMRDLSLLLGIGKARRNRLEYKQLPVGGSPQQLGGHDQAVG